jgi:RNA polymerase sigma factor (sigma-70 family)
MKPGSNGQVLGAARKHDPRDAPRGIIADYLAVKSSLRKYLIRFFVRPQDVEDLLQETFLRAFQSEKSQQIRSPRSFLYKIGKNLALSEKAAKATQLMTYIGDFDELSVIDGKASAEDSLDLQQRIMMLNRVIQALPPQCRRVLVMRKVFGLSHKEVARRLNISVKTVEQHLTKGLEHCHNHALEVRGSGEAGDLTATRESAEPRARRKGPSAGLPVA